MGYRIFLLLFFGITAGLHAQTLRTEFVGTLSVKGGDSYAYKLHLSDSDGVLTGYSVTDVMGPNETKTAIVGSIDEKKKQINFRETKVLQTKTRPAPGDFCCLVYGHLKVGKIQGTQTLKGSFTGYRDDGKTECASGKLAMVCPRDILEKMLKAQNGSAQQAKKDTVETLPKPATIVYDTEIPESQIKKVMPGNSIGLDCPASSVTIELWDFRTIDGDRITLTQDDKPVLENYTLTATHKILHVKLDGNPSVLELIALNEGTEPLNTARIRIACGNKEYYLDASTTVDKSVKIALKRP